MYVSIEVPDIVEYPKGFPNFWIKSILIQSVSTNVQVNALAKTYVRLVEAALVEYRLGATKLREFWDTHDSFNLGAINRSIAHFESCLLDTHRAVNCFRRLRRHRGRDELSLALNAEKPAFVTERVAGRLRDMRDEIHHLDEVLVSDEGLKEGQPVALYPDGPERAHPTEADQTIKSIDRLVIGRRELLFSDLTAMLIEMGRYAEKIAEFSPANTPANCPVHLPNSTYKPLVQSSSVSKP